MIDCVVVGGGPAGLAASAALANCDVEHVVLERGRVGETLRSQRWDSFRLNTPGWANAMLGDQSSDYLTGAEVIERLEKLAAGAPVHEGVKVIRLAPERGRYALDVDDGVIWARTVVVATGDENVPRIPALARAFPDRIAQYHAADYRNPRELPDGAVLVVGSAQSGCQIAEDLLACGRRVMLATSAVARVPTPYRGRHIIEWAFEAGWFNERPQDLPDPAMMREPIPIFAPCCRALSLQALARAGATLAGRLVAVDFKQASFDGSAAANVAAGDEFAAQARAVADEFIARTGVEAPPAEPDDADVPVDLDPPAVLDLDEIGSVVWCTGFTGDFSWLDPALLEADGRPRRLGCAAALPGICYIGLNWLTHRGSGALLGIPQDAATVAAALAAQLTPPKSAFSALSVPKTG
ncbi:MAG: NAD(P)-binding domain-containing protein [Actinomycetota bacterium]|nr:NAD(P)-binding domain-containing protein [Actinomycetota bacterium]